MNLEQYMGIVNAEQKVVADIKAGKRKMHLRTTKDYSNFFVENGEVFVTRCGAHALLLNMTRDRTKVDCKACRKLMVKDYMERKA